MKTNSFHAYFVSFFLLLLTGLANAQTPSILHLEEYDQRGKTHRLTKKNTAVDVNSIINISVNKDSLRLKIGRLLQNNTGTANNLLQQLEALSRILQGYTKHMQLLNDALDKYAAQPRNEKDLSGLIAAYENAARKAVELIEFAKGTPLENQIEERFEQALQESGRLSVAEQYLLVFDVANTTLQNVQQQVDVLIKEQGVLVQMGAWIVTDNGTRPIRLEGFGDVEQGERFEVNRNAVSLTEQQVAELRGYQQVFAENATTLNNLTKKAQKPLTNLLEKVNAKVDELEQRLQTLLDNAENAGKSVADSTKETIQAYIDDYKADLDEFNQKYLLGAENTDAVDLLAGLEGDVRRLVKRTEDFVRIDKQFDQLKMQVLGNSELETSLADVKTIIAQIKDVKKSITQYVANFKLLIKGRQVNAEALVFTDDVFKLAFADVPESTQFNLLFTGNRAPGDLVVLKIAALYGKNERLTDLEVHNLRLANALPHISVAVAYAFALPLKNNPDDNWLGGPSYSMLFKFGSRNMLYRNFIDAGIGINFAAFDFNRDGNPEISAGAAASLFRDYVQGGIGFNFSANSAYFHVGLRIPIPSASIGLFKNDKGQENAAAGFEPGN
ncbi:hypothetical protein C7N43_07710 [Sphingobacteriales bacterium UPWRP_1]|nr:hypothetical protein B6N25_09030 [Sphingobacteriales bacterium TSM_CSS]PSJ77643.1 hypothetical protein C7N43_07710 [Sphingobacteriales bacterium UPWRP_1]